jgi:hypothetical protein
MLVVLPALRLPAMLDYFMIIVVMTREIEIKTLLFNHEWFDLDYQIDDDLIDETDLVLRLVEIQI